MGPAALLRDPRYYLHEIEQLDAKFRLRHQYNHVEQDGVNWSSISINRLTFSRLLADSVGRGRYELQPGQVRVLLVRRKPRRLYAFRPTDRIVHGVIASVLVDLIEPQLSPHLYSYRRGSSWCKALGCFARYLRDHRDAHPDPRTRGVFVIRRDIRKYTDNIPVGSRSPLWPMLRHLLYPDGFGRGGVDERLWRLVEQVVRPDVYSEDGFLLTNTRGVATGSPVSTALFNLYLMEMDEELGTIPGGFYGRYCDDFLFAHADPAVVQVVSERIDEILESRGLSTSREKNLDLFFNGAGRRSDLWPEAQPTTCITFLGCNVSFDGTIQLQPKKMRKLLHDLSDRARRTFRASPNRSWDKAGPAVCAALNHALSRWSTCRTKSAPVLRGVVTDRHQLKQLDYQIARIVVRTLTGRDGVRAFRLIFYRTVREQFKLLSLHRSRDRAGRHRVVAG